MHNDVIKSDIHSTDTHGYSEVISGATHLLHFGFAPRIKGRPQASEPYQKVTVCLFDRHVLFLDKVALAIREKTGKHVKRAELVRSIVDHAAAWVRPDKPDADFDKAVRSLLPSLE